MSLLLHKLIHSLSKSEKRHFRLFCSRQKGTGNYLKLFDAIEKQAHYDDKALHSKFGMEPFFRQIHVTKHYLRNQILRSLRDYHTGISKNAQLKHILLNAEILFNKELYDECRTEVLKAEKLAIQHDLLASQIEVTRWKRKLIQILSPQDYNSIGATIAEQKHAIDSLARVNTAWRTAVEVSSSMFRETEETRIVRNIRLKSPDNKDTLETHVLHYNTQYLLDLRNQNNTAAERQLKALVEFLETNPGRLREDPALYISSLNNLLAFLVFQKRYEEALILIRKAKHTYDAMVFSGANRILLKHVLRTYNIELEIYRNTRHFYEHEDFILATEKFISGNQQKIPNEYLVSFWFQLASVYFIKKDYDQALNWVNRILNARFRGVRTDLIVQAHLLNLMIHLEQQNLMVLRYFVDSAKRYVRKVRYNYPYVNSLFQFFIQIANAPVLEHRSRFSELHSRLYPDDNNSLVPDNLQGFIDFRLWLQEKM